MEKVKNRSEIAKEDQWNLDSIYNSEAEFFKDLEEIEKDIDDLGKKKDSFLENSTNFKDTVLLDNKISRKLDKLATYASLLNSEDLNNDHYQELVGKINVVSQNYSLQFAYFELLVLKEKKEKILSFVDEEKELHPFLHYFDDFMRYQGHTLSLEEERLIAAFSKVIAAGSEAADYLMDADMRFGNIINENNEEVELTSSNYSIFIRSKDRRVRKDAFNKFLTKSASSCQ